MSASDETLECGTMKSHVPAMDGYCAFMSGETEIESVSHRFAIFVTSSRVNVIVVFACTADRRVAAVFRERSKGRGGGEGARGAPPWPTLSRKNALTSPHETAEGAPRQWARSRSRSASGSNRRMSPG